MVKIPEILKTISGEKVSSVETWERFRRNEILNLFCEYVYGVRDIERPENLSFVLKEERMEYGMRVKEIDAVFDDYSFPFKVYLPKESDRPVPVFVYVMHENLENKLVFDEEGNMRAEELESELPLADITKRGYAVAVMPTKSIYLDWYHHADFKQGVFTAVKNPKGRQKNSWATISAWAWGVSRVIDYLETDSDIDSSKIASIGHSRSGKTALWAAATDSRICLAVPNNSGCMGASVLRGKKGEQAKNISVTDWFCDKFREYSESVEFLPVDQHMLLALMAPRYVYVTSSSRDDWADPDAEFLSARLASEIFELYGLKGLVVPSERPEIGKVYQEGHIAYHVKEGDHSQTKFDWEQAMDYFDKICADNES